MSSVPNQSSRFTVWNARRTQQRVLRSTQSSTGAQRIDELTFRRAAWEKTPPGRGRKRIDPPNNIDDIIAYTAPNRRADTLRCAKCGWVKGENRGCANETCYKQMRDVDFVKAEAQVELRDVPGMGIGVFVRPRERIVAGQALGEYLGELYPLNWANLYNSDYSITFEKVCVFDAARQGNWTRYMNSSCNPNAQFEPVLIGDRQTVILRATNNIAGNQQICVSYGGDWFKDRNLKCCCDAIAGLHDPPNMGAPNPVAVSAPR